MEATGQHGCPLLLLPMLFCETGFLTEPGTAQLDNMTWSTSSWGPPVSASPVVGLQVYATTSSCLSSTFTLCLCGSIWIQMSSEARGIGPPGAGVPGDCESAGGVLEAGSRSL